MTDLQLAEAPYAVNRRARLARADLMALGFLGGFPVLILVLPALAGHPVLAGDNQIQNYPLRVLAGQMLRAGHLPLWDPWIWSGSPLLGGLNAGALYPGTLLYAALPGLAAWTANLVLLYWVAAFGVYALARAYGMGPLASALGAASFAFAGFMTAQMVHLGIVQGAAWIPWMVLGELRLASMFLPGAATTATGSAPVSGGGAGTARPGARSPTDVPARLPGHRPGSPAWVRALGWSVEIGVCGGLVLLVGEPRSMADAAWVCLLCPLWWVTRRGRGAERGRQRRGWFVLCIAGSAALATALGGVQLFSGIRFLSTTQRSGTSLSFFGSGSLEPRWSALLLVPDILGGDGILHQPQYFGGHTLPEMTGYVGLVACVGAVTLLARSIGRGRPPEARTWSVWIVVAAAGLLLSFGTYTFLGGPLSHIPFYGALRIQSRNLTIVDLGLCMLLAFWVDSRLKERAAAHGFETPEGSVHGELSGRNHWWDLVGLAPALAAGALCIALIAVPARLEAALGISASGAAAARGLRPWAVLQLCVVASVVVLVVSWPRVALRSVRRWTAVVVGVDLLVFSIACSTGFVAGRGVPLLPTATDSAALGSGRFAVYDPHVIELPSLIEVGETDLNALTRHPSVQGYGSAVRLGYDRATGTHLDGTLSACALEIGNFGPLGLDTILALPGSVAPALSPTATVRVRSAKAKRSRGCGIEWPRPDATSRRWLFEGADRVDRVDIVPGEGLSADRVLSLLRSGSLHIWVIGPDGSIDRPSVASVSLGSPQHGARFVSLQFSDVVRATGLVAAGPGAGEISDSTNVSGPEGRVILDGALQNGLDRGAWHYAGRVADFVRYELEAAPRTVWIASRAGSGGSRSSVARLSTTPEGGETDEVDAVTPVIVARSEAYAQGWSVVAQNLSSGRSQVLPVTSDGLVQAVSLPAGHYRIVWRYWAPGLSLGLASGALGVVVVLGSAVVVYRRRPRHRP